MSLHEITDNMITRIRSITPTWDVKDGFVCHEDATGFVLPIEELPDLQMRSFDLRLDPTYGITDDGIGGWVANRWRTRLLLRIVYPLDGDRGRVERIIGSDAVLITRALLALPYPESLESVVPPTPPTLTALTGADGRSRALVATYRVELIYTEGEP